MSTVNDLTIEKKLILVYMSTSGLVLVLTFIIILQVNSVDTREYLVSGLKVVANIVAESGSASVAI